MFPSAESETAESKKVREETFEKVIKMAEVKKTIRDKELWEADVKIEDEKVVNATATKV